MYDDLMMSFKIVQVCQMELLERLADPEQRAMQGSRQHRASESPVSHLASRPKAMRDWLYIRERTINHQSQMTESNDATIPGEGDPPLSFCVYHEIKEVIFGYPRFVTDAK